MGIELRDGQLKAIKKLRNGSILCGGVGSGKSRTALGYYVFEVCKGSVRVNGAGRTQNMENPRDLYIITTAKKRDSLEWEGECSKFALFKNREESVSKVQVVIDSWNNIKKYKDVYGEFFIFDEQRLVGSGSWVKTFLNISRKNQWILLSATPGDQWTDYIPVFVANGFFKNKTEFNNEHVVFSRFSKYPKIERYVGEKRLEKMRDQILVPIECDKNTIRHHEYVMCDYDKELYRTVFRERWDPYENEPIKETGKLMYLLRRVVNSDESRLWELDKIIGEEKYVIIFYNFDYELDMIKKYLDGFFYWYTEWNGHKHQEVPSGTGDDGWAYLVQYSAGCEGWNCIKTNAMIFFSQNYSYRVLEQAEGRIDRLNTPFTDLHYYHLISSAPIDRAIAQKLKDKQNFNEKAFLGKFA